jgi:hypothetical protein
MMELINPTVHSKELHDNNVSLESQWFRAGDASTTESSEVAILFLGPRLCAKVLSRHTGGLPSEHVLLP